MIKDFTYCSGYQCPLKDKCKRFGGQEVLNALAKGVLIPFISSHYNSDKNECSIYLSKE